MVGLYKRCKLTEGKSSVLPAEAVARGQKNS